MITKNPVNRIYRLISRRFINYCDHNLKNQSMAFRLKKITIKIKTLEIVTNSKTRSEKDNKTVK